MQNTLSLELQPMEISNFLTLDSEPLSLEQSLSYLQTAGKLSTVIREIAQQYILEKHLKNWAIPEPQPEIIEQFILEFRLQQQLTSAESFQRWLATNSLSYADFKNQVIFRLKLEQLKEKVTAPKIQQYFEQRQQDLDRVVFSRIVVDKPEFALDLKHQIEEQNADFTQLAKQYSVVDDAVVGGVMAPLIRAKMPDFIRNATQKAGEGEIIGPLQIEGRYCLLKVEKILPATLEGVLKRDIETQIFEEWLAEKMQAMDVKLNFLM